MSNTATVTPYASASANATSDIAAVGGAVASLAGSAIAEFADGAIVATAALVNFLCEETDVERAAVERAKAERRRRVLRPPVHQLPLINTPITSAIAGPVPRQSSVRAGISPLTTLPLTIRNSTALLTAAAKIGYSEIGRSADYRLLRNKSGERLAIHDGRLGVTLVHAAAQPRATAEALVRQHTMDQVIAHMQSQGMSAAAKQLTNGEFEIAGREPATSDVDDQANVTVRVKHNGELHLDVEHCVGNRCEAIAKNLAVAVGGKVTKLNKKDAYFRPVRKKGIRVRV